MKKVLIVSQQHSIFTNPITRAFQHLGWEVRFVDYFGTPFLMPNTLTHRIFSKLPGIIQNPLHRRELQKVDLNILRVAREYKPDLVFVSKGKNLGHAMLDELRKNHIVVNWYSETMDHWARISNIAPHYSYFFNFDPTVVEELKKIGYQHAYYLPFCADLAKDALYPEGERPYPISFSGSFNAQRYALREKVMLAVKDLGVSIWGNKAWRTTALKDFYRGYSTYEGMMEVYRKSKISIGMHVFGVPGTGVNPRPFEIASGGALMINHAERAEIFNLYTEGKEFISFHDEHDIREKVVYYLEHKEERERIARAGFERTKQEHTYIDRITEVLRVTNLL